MVQDCLRRTDEAIVLTARVGGHISRWLCWS
jgi:hypothetical protein